MKCTRRKFLKAGLIFVPATALSQSVIIRKWYSGCHPTAVNWAYRIAKNGGAFPQPNVLLSTSLFCATLENAGLLSRLYLVNTFPPIDLPAMRVPLITIPSAFDPWVRQDFGPPVVTDEDLTINGWRGSADRFHMRVYDTGFICSNVSALTSGNGGMSVYCSDASILSTGGEIAGGYDGVTRYFTMQPDEISSNHFQAAVFDVTDRIDIAGSDQQGYFFMISRSATNVLKAYRAKSGSAWAQYGATQTGALAQTPLPTTSYCGGAFYSGTGVNSTSVARQSFFSIHDGFSSAEGQTVFNAVQALRVGYGGGFL